MVTFLNRMGGIALFNSGRRIRNQAALGLRLRPVCNKMRL